LSVDSRGYRLEDGRIIGKGGPKRAYRLNEFPQLYLMFARCKTPQDLIDFVHKFGRLTHDTFREDGKPPVVGDDVREVLAWAKTLSETLGTLHGHMGKLPRLHRDGPVEYETAAVKVSGGMPLPAKLRPWLVPNPLSGRWELQLQPLALLDAIWFQFAQAVVGGLRQCKNLNCTREPWFRVGKGTNRGAKAEFCSDECRIEFNNSRR
jgi:hypothetical protein